LKINSFVWDNAVNTGQTPARGNAPEGAKPVQRPVFLVILTALLFAEGAMMIVVFAWLLVELITTKPTSTASAIAILVLAGIGVNWVLIAAVGSLRSKSWMRGAAVSWQLVQGAVAIGCFQGLYAQPALGWALLIPAIAGILLVISPSVTRATRHDPSV
jgi:hypothetical protein